METGNKVISFDMVSLFTKVPVKETLEVIAKRRENLNHHNKFATYPVSA